MPCDLLPPPAHSFVVPARARRPADQPLLLPVYAVVSEYQDGASDLAIAKRDEALADGKDLALANAYGRSCAGGEWYRV